MTDLKFGAGPSAMTFGAATRKRPAVKRPGTKSPDIASDDPKSDNALDTAWLVLEAANDLGDTPTIEACRRVIDANLNGTPALESDLHIILHYFR
jgi:hypothetical protein